MKVADVEAALAAIARALNVGRVIVVFGAANTATRSAVELQYVNDDGRAEPIAGGSTLRDAITQALASARHRRRVEVDRLEHEAQTHRDVCDELDSLIGDPALVRALEGK